MDPTEPQLLAFIQWLEDEQPDSPIVPAAKALAELTLEKLRSGARLQPFNRALIAIAAGFQSGDPDDLHSADHEIARRSLKARDFRSFFEGWKDRQVAWLRQTDHEASSFIDLLETGSEAGGYGRKKGYQLVSIPISNDSIRPGHEKHEIDLSDALGSPGEAPAEIGHDAIEGDIAEVASPSTAPLHYEMTICQRDELTAWGKVTFKDGVLRKKSWRWMLHSGRFVFAAVATGLVTFFGLFLPLGGPHMLRPVEIAASMIVIAYIYLYELRPWLEVTSDRIRMASDTWLRNGNPAQIEICRNQGDIEWRLVRYTAVCPVCASRVYVEKGEPDFPRRLVGRCSESPREHVFSFDRITRRGTALIYPP